MPVKWGQNFLVSGEYAGRIAAEAAGVQRVLEIGPGRGILTLRLLERGSRVEAVEIDPELCDQLAGLVGDRAVTIHNQDILRFDFDVLGAERYLVIGNIPYEITSPLIEKLLVAHARWEGIVLLVQKEVAERMCAPAGSEEYSALSVMVAAFSHPRILFNVHRSQFRPRPRVDSSLVRLDLLDRPLVFEAVEFTRFLKSVFSRRRKQLHNALRVVLGGAPPGPDYDWLRLDARIEEITPSSIARLFEQIRADPRHVRG